MMDGGRRISAAMPGRLISAAVFLLYLAISVVMWWHVWVTGHPTTTITCPCGDAANEVWWLEWAPWAVTHGHNPFFSNALYAGQGGVNALTNTSTLLPSLLLAPVTLGLGPIASFNVLATLAPAFSGWCMYLLVRRFTTFVPGQILAGALWAFSPLIVFSLPLGHAQTVIGFYPPIMALLLYDLLISQRQSPVVIGLGLAAATVAAFFTGSELLVMTAMVGLVGVAVVAALSYRLLWQQRRRIGVAAIVGAVVGGILLAYPAHYGGFGPRHITGWPWPANPRQASKTGAIIHPGRLTNEGSYVLQIIGYFGHRGPQSAFLGSALLLFLAVSGLVWWRRRMAWAFLATGVTAWVLSLGVPPAGDHRLSVWALFQHVPLVEEIQPVRFSDLVAFSAAGLLALSCHEWWKFLQHRRPLNLGRLVSGLVVTVVGTLVLLPIALEYSFPFVEHSMPTPRIIANGTFDTPSDLTSARLLILPYPEVNSSAAMVWQASSSMAFDLLGGYVTVPGAHGTHDSLTSSPGLATHVLQQLTFNYNNQPAGTTAQVLAVREAVDRWNPTNIVVTPADPDAPYAVAYLTAVLGRPPRTESGSWVWNGVGSAHARVEARGVIDLCTLTQLSHQNRIAPCVMKHSTASS
jgi:hypothetical protein